MDMSQFGAQKSPWGRAPGGQQLNPQLFTGQLGLAAAAAQQFAVPHQAAAAAAMQQLNAAGLGGLGAQMLPAVNAAAFSQPPVSLSSAAVTSRPGQMQGQPPQKHQRAFVGIVTKMQENYGFVDDDVFFQVNVVRGAMPRVGDRVMVEANYNPSMPFKWNAFRIQLLPNQDAPTNQVSTPAPRQRESERWGPPTNTSSAPTNDYRGGSGRVRSPIGRRRERTPPPRRPSPHRRSPVRRRSPSPRRHSSVMSSSSSLKRERSPRRSPDRRDSASRSPPRRRQRIIPRYSVHVPPTYLDSTESSVIETKRRYPKLYVPSDFFAAEYNWQNTFSLRRPLTFEKHCAFHVMHKEAECLTQNDAVLDPPDADHRYCAKVMLLSVPPSGEFYRKTLGVQEDETLSEDAELVAPSRVFNFLVGLRGKSEVLAIGGPYSPSLDGSDPENDPSVLIRTAIRTCGALTGLDLSKCTQWFVRVGLRCAAVLALIDRYKAVTLEYRRVDKEIGAPGFGAPRVDKVVIFIPDVWTLLPTKLEFEDLQTQLVAEKERRIALLDAPPPKVESTPSAPDPEPQEVTEEHEEPAEQEMSDEAKATKWSELEVGALKVAELREELGARSLDKKGVKTVLASRLQEALDKEKQTEEEEAATKEAEAEKKEEKPEDDDVVVLEEKKPEEKMETEEEKAKSKEEEEEKKALDEKELQKQKEKELREKKEKKTAIERHYALPSSMAPSLLVYPNKKAKGGKFDCKLMSLNALLDYRQDDNKEHSFEVSMFAEAFNEMLTRDSAFSVYKALLSAPDKEAEKKQKEAEAKAEKEAETKTEETDKPEAMDTSEPAADSSVDSAKSEGSKEGDTESEKKEDKKEDKKESDKKDDKKAADKKREESKKQAILIKDPALLFAFGYFDQSHCGYLYERDAEEILYSIGLRLSRAQVQRILKRLVTRDTLNYRKLTDTVILKDTKEVKTEPIKMTLPNEETLLQGNISLRPAAVQIAPGSGPPDVSGSGAVLLDGTLIDVTQILNQTKRLEKEQMAMEQRNAGLEKELKSTRDRRDALNKKYRRLEDDYDKYKKRLHDAEKCLKTSQDDTVQLKTAMQECKKLGERIEKLVDKVMPSKDKSPKKKDEKKTEEPPAVKTESAAAPEATEEPAPPAAESNGQPAAAAESTDLTVKDEIVENEQTEADMNEAKEAVQE